MRLLILVIAVLAHQPCDSRSLPEDSVVSVYTTQPTTAGTHPPLDVYHQIANNIAERITSPIYKFLGICKNCTEVDKTTKKSWDNIELLNETPEGVTQPNYNPVDNDISGDRDVEELSVEALRKTDKKPEKITLYSSYLPFLKLETFESDTEANVSRTDDDDGLTLDDVEPEQPRNLIHWLELIGSYLQLLWGGLAALFNRKNLM